MFYGLFIFIGVIVSYLLLGYLFKHSVILHYVVKAIKLAPSSPQYYKKSQNEIKEDYLNYWSKSKGTDLHDLIRFLREALPKGEQPWFDETLAFTSLLFWPVILIVIFPIWLWNYLASKLPSNSNIFIKLMECQTEEKCEIKENIKNNLKTFKDA